MIGYFDTSAIVKRYVQEPGSEAVLRLWNESDRIATSRVGYAEATAAFRRKQREEPDSSELIENALMVFKQEWTGVLVVEVSSALEAIVDRLLAKYSLRGFDAIHLSSALLIAGRLREEVVFCCWDDKLCQAARMAGFTTVPSA